MDTIFFLIFRTYGFSVTLNLGHFREKSIFFFYTGMILKVKKSELIEKKL